MDRLLVAFIMVLSSLACIGQRISLPVERVPFDKEELEKGLWDASAKSELSIADNIYVSLSPKGVLRQCIGDTTDMYLLTGDTLLFKGYTVGREIGILTDSTVSVMQFPLLPGSTISAAYTGNGLAFGEVKMKCKGAVSASVVRRGHFVFAPGDTVDAVLTEVLRTEKSVFNPADTLNWDEIPGTTVELLRWSIPGSILPFALQLRNNGGAWRLFMTNSILETSSPHDEVSEEASFKDLLTKAQVSITPAAVELLLGKASGVTAEVYIIDISGNIFGRTSKILDEPTTLFSIPTSGLRHGNYMLVIEIIGEDTITEKRILAL